MGKKNKNNILIKYSFYFFTGIAILILFILVINILVNCAKIFVEGLPTKEPLRVLIWQFEDIDIAPIIGSILVVFILSLAVLLKYKPMTHILSVLDIAVSLFLTSDLLLLFAGKIPIDEEIEPNCYSCSYVDSQPSPWFWVTIVLSVIVISLSSALLTNVTLNKFILKKHQNNNP